MHVYIERSDEHKELEFAGTVQKLLDELDINVQTVLVLKNNALVTEDEVLSDDDDIKIITVVSGG